MIRLAKLDDLEFFMSVSKEMQELEQRPAETTERIEARRERYKQDIEKKWFKVADIGEQVAGFSYIRPDFVIDVPELKNQKYLWVHLVYVKENFRGKGVDKQLQDELVDVAKERGCTSLVGGIYETNTLSQKVHKILGFKQVGTIENEWQIEHIYQKKL
jgi:L-amino acid N-acyltransferase YncA